MGYHYKGLTHVGTWQNSRMVNQSITMKYLIISILSVVSQVQGQSWEQVRGVEEYEESWVRHKRVVQIVYDGTNLWNKIEEINTKADGNRASYANSYVTADYVWGHVNLTNLNLPYMLVDRHIQVRCNPDLPVPPPSINTVLPWTLEWVRPDYGKVGWYEMKMPATAIRKTYRVVGDKTYWNNCGNVWKIKNPTGSAQYFEARYYCFGWPLQNVTLGFTGYIQPPFSEREIVVRYEDLVNNEGIHAISTFAGPDTSDMNGAVYPAVQVNNPVLGTSGTQFIPSIPTRHYILDWLEYGIFQK